MLHGAALAIRSNHIFIEKAKLNQSFRSINMIILKRNYLKYMITSYIDIIITLGKWMKMVLLDVINIYNISC